MIKISKPYGYLIGVLLTFFIYFISQLFFFINTEKAEGEICNVRSSRRYDYFYVCFTTKDNREIKMYAGTNFKYEHCDLVGVIYKRNNPTKARLNQFSALWLMPCWPYIILWGLIMAFITGIYYGSRYVIISRKPHFSIKLSGS